MVIGKRRRGKRERGKGKKEFKAEGEVQRRRPGATLNNIGETGETLNTTTLDTADRSCLVVVKAALDNGMELRLVAEAILWSSTPKVDISARRQGDPR